MNNKLYNHIVLYGLLISCPIIFGMNQKNGQPDENQLDNRQLSSSQLTPIAEKRKNSRESSPSPSPSTFIQISHAVGDDLKAVKQAVTNSSHEIIHSITHPHSRHSPKGSGQISPRNGTQSPLDQLETKKKEKRHSLDSSSPKSPRDHSTTADNAHNQSLIEKGKTRIEKLEKTMHTGVETVGKVVKKIETIIHDDVQKILPAIVNNAQLIGAIVEPFVGQQTAQQIVHEIQIEVPQIIQAEKDAHNAIQTVETKIDTADTTLASVTTNPNLEKLIEELKSHNPTTKPLTTETREEINLQDSQKLKIKTSEITSPRQTNNSPIAELGNIVKDVKPTVATTTEPIVATTTEPIVATTTEPIVETTTEPIVETTTEPIVETTTEPIVETTTEPIVETTTEPTVATTTEPTVATTTEPTVATTTEPTVATTTEPTVATTTEPTVATTTTEPTGVVKVEEVSLLRALCLKYPMLTIGGICVSIASIIMVLNKLDYLPGRIIEIINKIIPQHFALSSSVVV